MRLVARLHALTSPLPVTAALTFIAYLAAINRDQPLLWAVAAMLSATLVAGFAWPRRLLAPLAVHRAGPSRAAEGEAVRFTVRITNSAWLPRFMVEVNDYLPFTAQGNANQVSAPVSLGLLAYLPGRTTREFTADLICEKRGLYRLGPVGLATSFPLGLSEARIQRDDTRPTLTVYPSLFNILALPVRGAESEIHRGGYLLPEGAGSAEFSGLREYRRGDNPRHIHWPTTARLGELIVREYEPLASARLHIAIDQAQAANIGNGRHATFEYAVKIAASMAKAASAQNIRVRVSGSGNNALPTLHGNGELHFRNILDALAIIDCDTIASYATHLSDLGANCARGESLIAFLADDAPHRPETLQALSTLRARHIHLHVIIFVSASFTSESQSQAMPLPGDTVSLIGTLLGIGATSTVIRKGDDLIRCFNP